MRKVGHYEGEMTWVQGLEKTECVYLILFDKIGSYIGSTGNIIKRFRFYIRDLLLNKYNNKRLQAAFNATSSFDVYELEKITHKNRRTVREQFYIDLFHPELNIKTAGLHYEKERFCFEIANLLTSHNSCDKCPHCGKPLNIEIK